jgi:cytochrome P450
MLSPVTRTAPAVEPSRPFDEIPEPPRAGLGGHLTDWLGIDNAKDVLSRLLRYAQRCGPIARLRLGPVNLCLVSDATLAAAVLEDPRANYKGASYILTRAVLDNVLLLNGKEWERHRGEYKLALKDVDAVGSASAVTTRFVGETRSGALRLDQAVCQLVGDIAGDFTAGVGLDPELEPHRRRIQYELAGLGIDLQCQPWAYLSPSRWLRLRQSVSAARAHFRAAVDARMARPDESRKDILNGFLRLARAGQYPGDPESIQEGVVNFFFTAHDVLASSVTWCLYLLARHPEAQAEVRAALAPGALDRDQLDACEPLARVVRESLRLFPGYALFGRTTRAPMDIGGYRVPRGTLLIVSPFVTHRLERYWTQAESFLPSRWAGCATAPVVPAARDNYLPFGSGARGCLASHLAVPILKTVVAHTLRGLELRVPAGTPMPKISYWGTAYAEEGLPVEVRSLAS